ncbi:MAG: 50S ribosomal protein L5 [Bacteroidales bacterium]|nr:50S ribosomal protein L5 [Bacteroidales bacterium]
MSYVPRLKEKYKEEIVPKLKEDFGFTSVMAIPKLVKITINQGLGDAITDKKVLEKGLSELTTITGQKAVPTYSRTDIASFKLRRGMPIGVKVTLRGNRMYEFLDRLTSVAMPRIRDFSGVSDKGFDGHGNFTFGVPEQIIFPEINLDDVNRLNGYNVTFVTTARTDKECYELLKQFGFPFKNES